MSTDLTWPRWPLQISQMHSTMLHLPPAKISQWYSIMLHLPPAKISQRYSITLHLPPKNSQMHSIMLHLPLCQNFTDAFHHVTPSWSKFHRCIPSHYTYPQPKFHRCIPSHYTYPPPPKCHWCILWCYTSTSQNFTDAFHHSITLHLPPPKISQMHSIMLHLPLPKFHRCIPSCYNTNIPTLNVARHNADKHSC